MSCVRCSTWKLPRGRKTETTGLRSTRVVCIVFFRWSLLADSPPRSHLIFLPQRIEMNCTGDVRCLLIWPARLPICTARRRITCQLVYSINAILKPWRFMGLMQFTRPSENPFCARTHFACLYECTHYRRISTGGEEKFWPERR